MEEIEGYFQRTLKRQVLGNVQPSHQGTSAFPLTIHDHPPSFPEAKHGAGMILEHCVSSSQANYICVQFSASAEPKGSHHSCQPAQLSGL